MILVGAPSDRLHLAQHIGVEVIHIDIYDCPEAEERIRLFLDAIPSGRRADVVL